MGIRINDMETCPCNDCGDDLEPGDQRCVTRKHYFTAKEEEIVVCEVCLQARHDGRET